MDPTPRLSRATRACFTLLCLSGLCHATFGVESTGAGPGQSMAEVRTIQPWLPLRPPRLHLDRELSPDSLVTRDAGALIPLSLASADLDADGTPDLIAGYRDGDRGRIQVWRGRPEAVFPDDPAHGLAPDQFWDLAPFEATGISVEVPVAPQFLAALHLDGDGRIDLVFAERGVVQLHWLSMGVSTERFRSMPASDLLHLKSRDLPGPLMRLDAPDVVYRDLRPDLTVVVDTLTGPELLIYSGTEGWGASEALVIELNAPAEAVLADPSNLRDPLSVLVVLESGILQVSGTVGEAGGVGLERRFSPLPWRTVAATVGDFVWDPEDRQDLALLASDGRIHFLQPGSAAAGQFLALQTESPWTPAFSTARLVDTGGPASLVRTRSSSLPVDGVAVVTHTGVRFVAGDVEGWRVRSPLAQLPVPSSLREAWFVDSSPAAAVLPMRLNLDALDDLVILRSGSPDPVVALTRPMSTFTVNLSGDAGDADLADGVCDTDLKTPGLQCTLRAAIDQANRNPGADYIGFDVSYVNLEDGVGSIRDPLTLEGRVGGTGAPVWLDGSADAEGLDVDSGNSVFRNLIINGALDPPTPGSYSGNTAISMSDNGSNRVEGCYLGIDRDGTTPRANFSGVSIHDSSSNVVGGTDARARNVISGNRAHGLMISGDSTRNTVQGNYFGLTAAGTAAAPNRVFGILLSDYSDGSGEYSPLPSENAFLDNVISGTDKEDPEIDMLGWTGIGMALNSISTVIRGNLIGLTADGTSPLPNAGGGIWVIHGTQNVIEENLIAFNGGDGITVLTADLERPARGYARISRNSIHSNTGLGINLTPLVPRDGVTPNDPADADTGPNDYQNFPELALNQDRDRVGITLRSRPNTRYRIELFSSGICDPSGHGEGQTYLQPSSWFGFPYDVEGTTDSTGLLNLEIPLSVPMERVLTATATDPQGNTSEFSRCAGEATEAIELTPRMVVGLGLCGTAAREIQVKDVVRDTIITTDPDVSYEWIRPDGLPAALATRVLDYWASKAAGFQLPPDPIARIEVSNGLVTFLTPGVNVLQAVRKLPGGKEIRSNYALLIGGELKLGEVESLDIAPWAVTSPATNLATALTQDFMRYMQWLEPDQDLDAPMVLFPPSAQACSPVIGALGDYGQVTVKSLKFKLFNGWISGVDLMAGMDLLGQVPAKHWLLGLVKVLGKTAPLTVAQFLTFKSTYEIGNPGQTDPFMSVVGQFGESAPYIAGFVSAKASGISGIQAVFEMNSFCVEGKATDLMPVMVLPDLEKVDVRNDQGLVEEPLEVGVNQTRDTHAVGMFNAFSSPSAAYDLGFDPLGQTGERLRSLAEKVVPGGRRLLEQANVTLNLSYPWGATLTDGLFTGGHYYFGAGFTWYPLLAKVRISSAKFQTLLPDFLADWKMNPTPNTIAEFIEGDPFSTSDNDRVKGLKPGLTQVDLDVCVVLTSLSRRTDSNGVRVLGGSRIRVQKFEDLRADGVKDANDPGINGWTISLQRVDNGKTVSAVTGPVDLNEDGTISDQEQGWVVFDELEPTLYRVREQEVSGWTRTTGEPAVIDLGSDQTFTARIGNFKHITIRGRKFEDQDGDGVPDAGEPGLSGWRIEVDLNSDGSVEHAAVTDSAGAYRFGDIGLGDLKGDRTFRVKEVIQAGWFPTVPLDDEPIPFFSGSEVIIDFGNFRGMTVRGVKFNDLNGNGVRDSGEPLLAGWTVEVDLNGDGVVDLTRTTDSAGAYLAAGVGPGDPSKGRTFTVRERLQTGWIQTFPGDDEAYPIHSGLTVVADFGNFRRVRWCGTKFNDLNGNGVRDSGEPGLSGWTVELVKPDGSVSKVSTDSAGGYCFADLGPGVHQLREYAQTDWVQTSPAGTGRHQFATESGRDRSGLDFGNFRKARICGVKFDDSSGSGVPGTGSGLANWQIELTEPSGTKRRATTGSDGKYCFTGLGPGVHGVAEIQQSGWVQSVPAAPGTYSKNLRSGDDLQDVHFGNRRTGGFVAVQLCGVKFEDLDGDGIRDAGEPGLAGWTVRLQTPSGTTVQSATTGADGRYCFGNVGQGIYHVREVPQPGWLQTFPAAGRWEVTTVSGVNRDELHLGNFRLGVIGGSKFNDTNRNGRRDGGEAGLANWVIFLDRNGDGVLNHPRAPGACDAGSVEPCRVTDAQGGYSFADLGLGQYSVREVPQPGWVRTSPLPDNIGVSRSGFSRTDVHFGNAPVLIAKTLYFPFYQGGRELFTAFAVSNYSEDPAGLRFTAYGADGSVLDFPNNPAVVQLAARNQIARLGHELFGVEWSTPQAGWVLLESDNPGIGSFFQFGDLAVNGLDGAKAVEVTSSRLYLQRVYEAPPDLSTLVSLANPGDQPAEILIRLTEMADLTEGDLVFSTETTRTIPPRGVLHGTVSEIFQLLPEVFGQLEVVVRAGPGIVGFHVIDQREPRTLVGLPAAVEFDSLESFSAQLASGPDIFTTLKLYNQRDETTYLYLEALGDEAEELGSGWTYLFPEEQYEVEVGWLFDADPESYFIGSLYVEPEEPGIFGDVLFGGVDGGYAAALPLQTTLFREAVFSHVANGLGFFTGLALFNPWWDSAEVVIEVFSPTGESKGTKTLTIKPWGRLSQTLEQLVPSSIGQVGGYILVRSSQPLVGQQLFGLNSLRLLSAVPPTTIEE